MEAPEGNESLGEASTGAPPTPSATHCQKVSMSVAAAAYKQTIRTTETPRDMERKVFTKITGGLERHADDGPLSAGLKDFLEQNQKFWLALRGDLIHPDNALPGEIKATLINLSFWVDRQTTSVLRGESDVRPLIEVNRSIMGGLGGQGGV